MKIFRKITLTTPLGNYIPNARANALIRHEDQMLAMGKLLSLESKRTKEITNLSDIEFKIFSQFGDDGIIQWIINNIDIDSKTFIEFGVENYRESNTRFLMMNNNWSGLIMDGAKENIKNIMDSEYYWRYDLTAKHAFVTKDNVNYLIDDFIKNNSPDLGLLHIDVDGNDYWIWDAVENINPNIVIVEYNSTFGMDRAITIPYQEDFYRSDAHYSNLYYGTSILALNILAQKKGYSFIGCNSAGNNAYFIRNDKLNKIIKPISIKEGFNRAKFRESKNPLGGLSYKSFPIRQKEIKEMPVFDVEKCLIEKF